MFGAITQSILHFLGIGPDREGVRRVLAYGAAQGWRMFVVDPRLLSRDESTERVYAVRYQDPAGALVEALLKPDGDRFRIRKQLAISAEVASGILDNKVAMDCRKCGAHIDSGKDQCPYCRTWRHELRIG